MAFALYPRYQSETFPSRCVKSHTASIVACKQLLISVFIDAIWKCVGTCALALKFYGHHQVFYDHKSHIDLYSLSKGNQFGGFPV